MNDQFLTQLTRIADALEALVNGGFVANTTTAQPITDEQIQVVETLPPAGTVDCMSADEFKDFCLTKVRAHVANKVKIKAVMAEFGAAKAVDVPSDKYPEVIAKINEVCE